MPWAPFPHYAVGALTPPTNNGTPPCKTSWNMSMMDTMVRLSHPYQDSPRTLLDCSVQP